MKTITIDVDIHQYLVARGMGTTASASAILRRELTRTIEIDDDLHAFILSLAKEAGESASSILRRELGLGVETPPPARVDFRIAAGTGSSPWNTREQVVVAAVGQVLRIVNDDAVPHRLHTSGAPFPHPETEILPGHSADITLQSAYNPDAQGPLHDHTHGPAAAFWIRVTSA